MTSDFSHCCRQVYTKIEQIITKRGPEEAVTKPQNFTEAATAAEPQSSGLIGAAVLFHHLLISSDCM